ncbi:MAG: DUF58 domain-containing protein [Betaproteobacteria bacterium]|nr:DUF58 domain-containing protein [Betaproteobacteria bacterium]
MSNSPAALQQRTLRQRISDWIFPARAPETPPVQLVQRRIFILPTRTGYFFVVVLVLLLIASINYSLSLGFMLTFLLAGMGGVGMLHTFANLVRLSISPGKVEAVHAGDTAIFSIVLANQSAARFSIGVKRAGHGGGAPVYADVGEARHTILRLPVLAERRGYVQCGRLEIFTEYPLGLFHAWSYVDFGMRGLVYPKADAGAGALPFDFHASGEGNLPVRGDEEFQSLRAYRPGDTPRQIAWKALAREQGLLVKEFGATASADLWLDFDQLQGLSTEQKLQRLTWWVLEAGRQQVPYGLRLPGHRFAPMTGAQHRDRCLEALALFGMQEP